MPESIPVRSNAKTLLDCRDSGTSPLIIFNANPSAIAVLPTPGSPSRIGLFFCFLLSICIVLSISSARPITGDSLPCFARLVKSTPNSLSTSSLFLLSFLMWENLFITSKTNSLRLSIMVCKRKSKLISLKLICSALFNIVTTSLPRTILLDEYF